MPDLSLFLPLTKVDAEQRLVYGVATAETKDRSGEVCDYASTKPFYEKWSGGIHKATDGKSLGNLRAMHGKVAAARSRRWPSTTTPGRSRSAPRWSMMPSGRR